MTNGPGLEKKLSAKNEAVVEIFREIKYNLIPGDAQCERRRKVLLWSKRISLCSLKLALAATIVLFVVLPFIFKYLYSVQRNLVFLNFVNWPRNPNYSNPEEYGLQATLNYHVTTDEDISLGVWHILPEAYINSSTPIDYTRRFFDKTLSDGRDIVIYNHGNSGHRIVPFRVEVYKLLRKQFHVIAWDYRSYGDSSVVEPTEDGLVADATYIYNMVVNRTEGNIFVWGHSLGTGVSTHMLAGMAKKNVRKPTGLVLESPFSSFTDEIAEHPFAKIFRPLPWFHYTVIDPMLKNGFVFESDKHIIKVDCPILILHAKDDNIVPYNLGVKLYDTAMDFRRDFQGNITMVSFEKELQYGHKFIYKAPEFSDIIRKFVAQSISEVHEKNLH